MIDDASLARVSRRVDRPMLVRSRTTCPEETADVWGDIWTWAGIDPDTKLTAVLHGGTSDTADGTRVHVEPHGRRPLPESRNRQCHPPRESGRHDGTVISVQLVDIPEDDRADFRVPELATDQQLPSGSGPKVC
jgi:hypothetical protein